MYIYMYDCHNDIHHISAYCFIDFEVFGDHEMNPSVNFDTKVEQPGTVMLTPSLLSDSHQGEMEQGDAAIRAVQGEYSSP